jgi:hypothetical protein
VEQRSAELGFQGLNGPREGGLRDVALLRRPGEIQGLAQGKEVARLKEFHPSCLSCTRSETGESCAASLGLAIENQADEMRLARLDRLTTNN